MVIAPEEMGDGSAQGEASRVPSMQLIRVGREKAEERQESPPADDRGGEEGGVSGGGGRGAVDEGAGVGWRVAVSSPMTLLQGFALAVIGLEAGSTGAAVTVVDRSAPAAGSDSARGTLGFDKVGILVTRFLGSEDNRCPESVVPHPRDPPSYLCRKGYGSRSYNRIKEA